MYGACSVDAENGHPAFSLTALTSLNKFANALECIPVQTCGVLAVAGIVLALGGRLLGLGPRYQVALLAAPGAFVAFNQLIGVLQIPVVGNHTLSDKLHYYVIGAMFLGLRGYWPFWLLAVLLLQNAISVIRAHDDQRQRASRYQMVAVGVLYVVAAIWLSEMSYM